MKEVVLQAEADPVSASQSIVTEFGTIIHLLDKSKSNTKDDMFAELIIDIKDLKDEVKNLAGIVTSKSLLDNRNLKPSLLKFRTHMTQYKNEDPVSLVVDIPFNSTITDVVRYKIFDTNDAKVQSGTLNVSHDTRYFTIWKVPASSPKGEYSIHIEYLGQREIVNFVVT